MSQHARITVCSLARTVFKANCLKDTRLSAVVNGSCFPHVRSRQFKAMEILPSLVLSRREIKPPTYLSEIGRGVSTMLSGWHWSMPLGCSGPVVTSWRCSRGRSRAGSWNQFQTRDLDCCNMSILKCCQSDQTCLFVFLSSPRTSFKKCSCEKSNFPIS